MEWGHQQEVVHEQRDSHVHVAGRVHLRHASRGGGGGRAWHAERRAGQAHYTAHALVLCAVRIGDAEMLRATLRPNSPVRASCLRGRAEFNWAGAHTEKDITTRSPQLTRCALARQSNRCRGSPAYQGANARAVRAAALTRPRMQPAQKQTPCEVTPSSD